MWWKGDNQLTDEESLEALGFSENLWAKQYTHDLRVQLRNIEKAGTIGCLIAGSIATAVLLQRDPISYDMAGITFRFQKEFWDRL